MSDDHLHRFEKYAGIHVFGDAMAWVPLRHVTGNVGAAPKMWRCECGEQGIEVPV